MHLSAKCNSGRIAIQWFHIKHYSDYQYTKFQPYTSRVQKMCVFARYATLVPRLLLFCCYLIQYIVCEGFVRENWLSVPACRHERTIIGLLKPHYLRDYLFSHLWDKNGNTVSLLCFCTKRCQECLVFIALKTRISFLER